MIMHVCVCMCVRTCAWESIHRQSHSFHLQIKTAYCNKIPSKKINIVFKRKKKILECQKRNSAKIFFKALKKPEG